MIEYIHNKNEKRKKYLKVIFYLIMIVAITCFLIAGYKTRGEAILSILFFDKNDMFMDYFNCIQYGRKPYYFGINYPPLMNTIFAFLGHFNIVGKGGAATRATRMGLMVYSYYSAAIYSMLVWIIYQLKQGETAERILFIVVMSLSLPFIYVFERGNSIVIALIFLAMYLKFYKSKETKLKYLAFFSLAIAASIKISPALFGVLLIKEKRYKDGIICAIIGFFVFMLPFLVTDGNIFALLKNIDTITARYQNIQGTGNFIDILNAGKILGRYFNKNLTHLVFIVKNALFIFGILGVCLYRKMDEWKSYGILAGLIVLTPGFSAIYNLVYMIIPLIFFLDNLENSRRLDYVYLLLFAGMFIPLVNRKFALFNLFAADVYPLRLTTFIECFSLLIFVVLLVSEVFVVFVERRIVKNEKNKCSDTLLQ